MVTDKTLADGSRLCVSCGLCCKGALHDAAALMPDEVSSALSLGLKVVESGSDFRFGLPCPLLMDRCCTVYSDRPSTCRNYKCRLLQSLEAGTSALDDCLDKVRAAQGLLSDLGEVLPNGMSLPDARASSISTVIEENAAKLANANIKLHAFALNVYLDKYFRNSHEGPYLRSAITDDGGK